MTENSEEIAELKRAHTALESKVNTILPTLATKADLVAMARHLTEEMTHRFDEMSRRFDDMSRRFDDKFADLSRRLAEGFNRILLWIAGALVALIIAILGSTWSLRQSQPPSPHPVVYYVYPAGYAAAPPQQLAPPTQR